MTDLAALSADQLARLVTGVMEPDAAAALAELQTRANLHDEKIREGWQAHADVEAELDAAEQRAAMLQEAYDNCDEERTAAEKERDEALRERDNWKGVGKDASDKLFNQATKRRAAVGKVAELEARLAETQKALERIASNETLLGTPGVLDRSFSGQTARAMKILARAALTTHPEAKP